jgi:hypothetical protein
LLLVLLVLIWGVSWPAVKVGVSAMPPVWFACLRYPVATVCCFAVVLFRGELRRPSSSDWRFVAVSGVLQMAAYSALTAVSLTRLPAGRASVLAFSTPRWVSESSSSGRALESSRVLARLLVALARPREYSRCHRHEFLEGPMPARLGPQGGYMKVTVAGAAAICIATWLFGSSAVATGAIPQRGQDQMGQDQKGNTRTKDISYTGCVEAGQAPRTYILTHVTASDDRMGRGTMAKDAMANDAMGRNATAKGAMTPSSLSIVSQAVDLSAHVGHKVTVSGTAAWTTDAMKNDPMSKDSMSKDAMSKDAMTASAPPFNVKTITTIASSCR